jgi:thiamine transporter
MTGSGLIHPVQVLLDYPLAYAVQGVAGWRGVGGCRGGIAIALILRLLAHSLASIFFLPATMNVGQMLRAALLYNVPFVFVDGVVAIFFLETLLRSQPGIGAFQGEVCSSPG